MNRRVLLSIILIFTILCVGVLFFYHLRGTYNHHVVSFEKWDMIKKARREDSSLGMDVLKFQDISLLFDNSSDTYYYSYQDSSKKFNPSIYYSSKNQSFKLVFSSKIDLAKIEDNYDFKIMIYDKEKYHIYHLVVTSLPLINIDSNSNLLEQNNAFSEVSIYDNRLNAFHKYLNSKAEVKVMDTDSTKKDFSFSLLQESLGNNKRENNISILGMNQHSEYALYSMTEDSDMIRTIFSTNLWNDMEMNSSEKYQYVEVFLNHQYYGLYVLGYNLEDMSLHMREQDTLFYKQSFDLSEKDYQSDKTLDGYMIIDLHGSRKEKRPEGEKPDAWKDLREYYSIISSDNIDLVKSIAKNHSAMNLYLFYLFSQASNHVNSETFSNTYMLFRKNPNGYNVEYIPWDIRYTFGESSSKDIVISSSDNTFVMKYNPVTRLVELKDSEAINAIYENFKILRDDKWSNEKLNTLITQYEDQLFSSGAYLRNSIKWSDGSVPKSKLAVFKTYVQERITSMEYYIKNLN